MYYQVILGVLSISAIVSAMYSQNSDDTSLPKSMDDFTFSPPRSHHHRTHIHHHHQYYHQQHHHNKNNDNDIVEGVDGRRRDSEKDEKHARFHYHQQNKDGEQEQIMEIMPPHQHKDSPEEENLHQEDSPHYGRYSNTNKYNHEHVNCHLPEAWAGKWFQSGIPNPVLIDNKSIEGKGTCYESSGDKFLFVEKGNCHRCVVINERHHNVLEYKESTFCEEKNSLENLCSLIPGDAMLFSLFRIDALPIHCPFKGPYTFTYNKGSGLCKSPVSHVDTCTEPSRLLLRYEACPDPETESKVEELQCLAGWRDSTYHYLVGKLGSPLMRTSDEDLYRCFIYEIVKGHTIVKIAVSGDATCTGLSSPTEGAKTLTFTKVNENSNGVKCKFPSWVSSYHWNSLDGNISLKTNHKNSTMHIADTSPQDGSSSSGGYLQHPTRGGGISGLGYNFGNSVLSPNKNPYLMFAGGTRITCQAVKDFGDEHVAIVAQHTQGCTSTTVCLNFYKRTSHVIELQIGKKGYDDSDCTTAHASGPTLPYVTLIRAETYSHRCPYLGKYMASGLVSGGDLCPGGSVQRAQHGTFHSVVVGCGQRATMDFHSKCVTQDPITSYECHGTWEENGTGFLIASPLSRSSSSARRYCFTYLETDQGLSVFSSSQTCRRDVSPNGEGIWAFNLTIDGQCAEPMTGGAASARSSIHCDVFSPSYFLLVALLTVIVSYNNSESVIVSVGESSSDFFYSPFAKIVDSSFSTQRIPSYLLTCSEKSQPYQYHQPLVQFSPISKEWI